MNVRTSAVWVVVAAVTLAVGVGLAAKVKVRTQHDKSFDFRPLKTWAWHPDGAGDVKMLQASGGNAEDIKTRLDPVIRGAVERAMTARGFTEDATNPGLHVNYYLLIGPGISSQTMGQFVGNAPEWGLPPFVGATTAFKAYEQGSLILDMSAVAQKAMVWRGVAEAEIDRQANEAQRARRIQDAIAEMLKKFPPKK